MLEARHRLEATSGFREEQLKAQEGLLKEAQGKAREERRRLRDMGLALRGKMRAAQEVDAIRQREAARATVGAGNVRTQNPFAQPASLVRHSCVDLWVVVSSLGCGYVDASERQPWA